MRITTVKGLRALTYGDTVDFTKFRLGSKPPGEGRVVKCPRCGKHGTLSVYKGDKAPFGAVTHRKKLKAGPFPHWLIESGPGNHCALSKEELGNA